MSTIDLKKRKLLLQGFQNGLTANQTTMQIAEKFGNKGYGVRTCQRWFRKFRDGDFNLLEKPSHRYSGNKKGGNFVSTIEARQVTKPKSKRVTQKEVRVDSVTFKQEQRGPETGVESPSLKFDAVQQLIQRKSEITLLKVNNGNSGGTRKKLLKPNIITKRLISPTNKKTEVLTMKDYAGRPVSTIPVEQRRPLQSNGTVSHIKQRGLRSIEADLQLPPNIAKRMTTTQSLTESYTIGDSKTEVGVKKPITVQFQNVSPELAKNTMRKGTEPAATPFNKRLAVPQSTPLSSPKGVIYLNPQEIFGNSFGYPSTLQRSAPNSSLTKSVSNPPKAPIQVPQPAVVPSQASQSPVLVTDSDSEDDITFPEDIALPAPKMKAVSETFTTYWDMEAEKPILLNPPEEVERPLSVIEID